MRFIALFLLLSGLLACGAQPQQSVNYYLLYTPSQQADAVTFSAKAKKVWLNKVVVADYLKQSSLTMQVNENQMYFSRQDVWAESLDSAIYKALLTDLNKDAKRQFVGDAGNGAGKIQPSVTVQFDYFHATDQSTVIASGHYRINLPAGEDPIEKPFFLTLPLSEDGYAHAVSQQRKLIPLLAQQIQQELTDLGR